ncbi:LamG domain-containing protein [Candidatus Poribacteria bacterium]|nr:LamG domain-containing protein [Candidatus Poribacteria bacterium]
MRTVIFVLTMFCLAGSLLSAGVAKLSDDKALILYLPFDEGNGDKTYDLSKSGLVGKLVKNPKWVDGKFGKALEFDGKSNYVQIDEDFSPQAEEEEGELSICAWVKVLNVATDAHSQTRQPIVMKGFSGEWEYALYVYDDLGAGFSLWQCGGSGHSEPHGGALTKDEWHFVAGTYKLKGDTKVYIDGKVVITDSSRRGKACNGTRPIMIAHREDGQFLNAVIDEVSMWSRELSEDEINQLMKGPLMVAVNPSGLLTTCWGRLKSER